MLDDDGYLRTCCLFVYGNFRKFKTRIELMRWMVNFYFLYLNKLRGLEIYIYMYSTKFIRFANAIDLSTLHNILYYF